MAQTYSISDALGLVGSSYPRLINDSQGAVLADLAQNMVWNHADWRTSIAEMIPFYMVPFAQDFGSPLVIVPADFQGLRTAYLTSIASDPSYRCPLQVRRTLETTHLLGLPELISYEEELAKFRVWPRCGDSVAAPWYLIEGTYKKQPVKITQTTVGSAFVPVDDRFFEAYLECLRYQFMRASKDPQAGGLQYNKAAGSYVATGQYAVAMAKLDEMAQSEAQDLGSDALAPAEPLMNW